MLEILYRIYKVNDVTPTEEELKMENEYAFESISKRQNTELAMDCMICESRDKFKETIRDLYGKNIMFAYSRKLKPNDVYCIIIGEHCWNKEKYFTRYDFECDNCGLKFHSYVNMPITLSDWELKWDLLSQTEQYKNKKFCCNQCKNRWLDNEKCKIAQISDGQNVWVNRGDYKSKDVVGYIYKITKKSTGEFYIGQTMYEPMFRWAQHLATDRFDIKGILDYQYETIEIVYQGDNILDREKYWIQKYYKENPDLSLNIMQTANLIDDRQLKIE